MEKKHYAQPVCKVVTMQRHIIATSSPSSVSYGGSNSGKGIIEAEAGGRRDFFDDDFGAF